MKKPKNKSRLDNLVTEADFAGIVAKFNAAAGKIAKRAQGDMAETNAHKLLTKSDSEFARLRQTPVALSYRELINMLGRDRNAAQRENANNDVLTETQREIVRRGLKKAYDCVQDEVQSRATKAARPPDEGAITPPPDAGAGVK